MVQLAFVKLPVAHAASILHDDLLCSAHDHLPLQNGLHQLLFRPRDSFDQRLLECRLEINPKPAEVRWIHDAFGNCITLVDFAAKTTVLQFQTFIRLEHTPENAPDFRIEDYARIHPFAFAEDEYPDLLPYIQRQYPEEKSVEQWLTRFVMPEVRHPTGQLLMTLNQAIAQSFSYKRRTARGTQSPDETIHYQEGTCRDFALMMMEAARSMGFAARFVTGYVYVPDRDGPVRLGGGSTHAWCQIYVPGSGWVEFDPTNGIVGNRDLIASLWPAVHGRPLPYLAPNGEIPRMKRAWKCP